MITITVKTVAMPEQMFGDGGILTARDSIAPDPAFLQMRGGDGQNVAIPLSGGKSLPGVRGFSRRMRTAIHPDGSLGRLPGNVRVIGDQLLRVAVHFLPDAQVRRTAPGVIGRMRAALILGQREQGRIPAIAPQARGVVDGQPEIIADIGPRDALQKIFVKLGRPLARRIHLRESRWNAQASRAVSKSSLAFRIAHTSRSFKCYHAGVGEGLREPHSHEQNHDTRHRTRRRRRVFIAVPAPLPFKSGDAN